MKKSINPYTGKTLNTFSVLKPAELEDKIELARKTAINWSETPMGTRAIHLRKVAELLNRNAADYAQTITSEMGKPISQAIAEVEKCAWVCEYYADNAALHLEEEVIKTDADKSYIRYEPLGVILAVMPWNYPLWQVFRFAAPALMAGNVGLLKHASNVLSSANLIETVFREAGLPDGCFQNLIIDTDLVEAILENPAVKAATLTGSMPAGSAVASMAGANIKKTVLELGGSNALVVFDDADMATALETCVQARFQNTGQSCIAGKRLLLHDSIADEFTEKFTARVRELKSGDPQNKATYIGVMAREDLAEDLEKQVQKSVAMGAKLLLGGKRDKTYFEPTVLDAVTPEMPVFKEETFGPAIGITRFRTEREAVDLVNNSDFGLGVSIFTSDEKRALRLIPQFYEGAVFVNDLVKSDPRLPFGGVKTSGYGRELSPHGIREFVNVKTVYIKGV